MSIFPLEQHRWRSYVPLPVFARSCTIFGSTPCAVPTDLDYLQKAHKLETDLGWRGLFPMFQQFERIQVTHNRGLFCCTRTVRIPGPAPDRCICLERWKFLEYVTVHRQQCSGSCPHDSLGHGQRTCNHDGLRSGPN